jgi:hypothetical protein
LPIARDQILHALPWKNTERNDGPFCIFAALEKTTLSETIRHKIAQWPPKIYQNVAHIIFYQI